MDLTQEKVNEVFKDIKKEWDQMVSDSGKSEAMFVLTDSRSSEFLYNYQVAKDHVESHGLLMPTLVEGLEIKLGEDDE